MSDIQPTKTATGANIVRQKIFNVIGWIAFLFLLPSVLKLFDYPKLQILLEENLHFWGSSVALLLYFYVILLLRVFFGSDQRYTPVFIGIVMSFIFFSNSLDISFMQWLRNLSSQVSFLAHPIMSCIAGFSVIFISNALSKYKKASWIVDVLLLVILPVGLLILAGIFLPGTII